MAKKKNKEKDKEKDKDKKGGQGLWNPETQLEGKDMRKFVRNLVKLQTRPQIRAHTRHADQLRDVLSEQIDSQKALGKQATTNISGFYQQLAAAEQQNLARQEALGGRLTSDTQAAGTQAQQGIEQAGAAGVARLDQDAALRLSTPSRARDELQQMIAEQQGFQHQNQAAMNANAQGQANDWESAMGVLGQANQMRGAQNLSDVQREVINRMAELQQSYAPGIQESLGAAADVRASRGDLKTQILHDLRGSEREYGLSRAALDLDKKELKSSNRQANKDRKASAKSGSDQQALVDRYEELARLKARLSRKGQSMSHANNVELAKLKGQISKKNIARSQGGSNQKESKLSQFDSKQKASAKNFVGSTIRNKPDGWIQKKSNQTQLIDYLQHSRGINPILTKWAIKKQLNKGKGKYSDGWSGNL